MLAKRIIPCLDIKDGRTVKGVHFENIRDAGDPIELARRYVLEGADELVFLDITATNEKRKTLTELVYRISESINIPFTVGGGITSIQDVEVLLNAGADKISVNSAAVKNPLLINDLAHRFGSQCIVVAIDTKKINGKHVVHLNGGRIQTSLSTINWAIESTERGAGEILLTSMDSDGTEQGFDIRITKEVSSVVSTPVIASGGAGNAEDFLKLFLNANADGALAASVFHFGQLNIKEMKVYLKKCGIEVRI